MHSSVDAGAAACGLLPAGLSASIVAGPDGPNEGSSDMTNTAGTERAPGGAARRVLVVEDEMLIGMLLEDMLADLGHSVVAVVPRVNEALIRIKNKDFDLAILDVHLNGQSVFPVADSLIEQGIPFMFATGYGERGLPDTYRGRPILQKPFAKDDLERVLQEVAV